MRTVWIADMHVGHRVGLANPAITVDSDPGAKVRRALFRLWMQATEHPTWRRPDVLIVNGDIVDGQGHKGAGTEEWTTDLDEQAAHAVELLKMWRAKRIVIVRGSTYHVEANGSGLPIEEGIGRKLNAEPYPGSKHSDGSFDHSGYSWYLTFDGVSCHVAHHVGISRVFAYRSTPITREMMQTKLNDGLQHEGVKHKTRVVVRAHAHYYWHCDSARTDGFNLPCWQALTPFQMKLGPLAISSDIGFVGMEFRQGKMRYEKVLSKLEEVQRAPHLMFF